MSVLQPKQFSTLSVRAVGKLASNDFRGMTMAQVASDPAARQKISGPPSHGHRNDPRYSEPDHQAALVKSIASGGVQKPIQVSTIWGPPAAVDGHHRYVAAHDAGVDRVPVRDAVKAAKIRGHYQPPGGYPKSVLDG